MRKTFEIFFSKGKIKNPAKISNSRFSKGKFWKLAKILISRFWKPKIFKSAKISNSGFPELNSKCQTKS